jgi:2-hydroxycyclohexanecarboxyl-CoA dehydrogenase
MGRATALLIARRGGRVLIGDIDEVRGTQLVEQAKAESLRIQVLPLDLTDAVSVDSFARSVQEEADVFDSLINVAGWSKAEPFLENVPELWQTLMGINLMGPIRLTYRLLPGLIRRGAGRIVNVSSDAGRVGSSGDTVYAAAKGGLIAFTKSVAREMAQHNILVNCVCPGPTDTPLFHQQPENLRAALIRSIPLKRLGCSEDVAEMLAFLSGPRAEYITGQVISVSGGLTMSG